MRNIISLIFVVLLSGCRVDILQILSASVDTSDQAPTRLRLDNPDANIETIDDFADAGLRSIESTLVDSGVVDARPHYSEICRDAVPNGTCPAHGWSCPPGFFDVHGNGRLCQEIDECEIEDDNCTEDEQCVNTAGSFLCLARDDI
jgi:hypothetical protein